MFFGKLKSLSNAVNQSLVKKPINYTDSMCCVLPNITWMDPGQGDPSQGTQLTTCMWITQ